jgi:hypothetical protein
VTGGFDSSSGMELLSILSILLWILGGDAWGRRRMVAAAPRDPIAFIFFVLGCFLLM